MIFPCSALVSFHFNCDFEPPPKKISQTLQHGILPISASNFFFSRTRKIETLHLQTRIFRKKKPPVQPFIHDLPFLSLFSLLLFPCSSPTNISTAHPPTLFFFFLFLFFWFRPAERCTRFPFSLLGRVIYLKWGSLRGGWEGEGDWRLEPRGARGVGRGMGGVRVVGGRREFFCPFFGGFFSRLGFVLSTKPKSKKIQNPKSPLPKTKSPKPGNYIPRLIHPSTCSHLTLSSRFYIPPPVLFFCSFFSSFFHSGNMLQQRGLTLSSKRKKK